MRKGGGGRRIKNNKSGVVNNRLIVGNRWVVFFFTYTVDLNPICVSLLEVVGSPNQSRTPYGLLITFTEVVMVHV